MGEEDPRDAAKRLKDQSKLLNKRAQRAIMRSHERVARAHHQWHQIAVGRVCEICLTAQSKEEFDDAVPCKAS